MTNKANIVLILLFGFLAFSFSPIKRYIRKAELNVERGNLEKARHYYEKALALEPENIRANFGMGMMLCELLNNYEKALPHLEKANQPPVEDSLYDLMFALGKCYQNNGEFEKAIQYFDRLQFVVDLDEEVDFKKDISKRRKDCEYALARRSEPPAENVHVVNGGRTINTEMPEYVPVLIPGNRMIFTSKRKDDEKERVNYLDGKYFESMYITEITPHGFRNTKRYTIPDQYAGKKKSNRHESVISLSQDGSKLFTFQEGSIFEVNMNERSTAQPRKLETLVNDDIYENHAYLSADGKDLYFSVEAESSLGGTDIYFSRKDDNGKWTTPVNLGEPINTPFDEDSPFLSPDGDKLYFASNGHPGFGNFDLYVTTRLSDGKWSQPENLGKPLNSPGHDLFLVHDTARATAYFASGRKGGFGDMDIYKVLYLDKIDTACSPVASGIVSLEIVDADSADYRNVVAVNLPAGYRVLSSAWWLDGSATRGDTTRFEHNYRLAGTHTVSSKVIALCDTCLSPVIACNSIVNVIPEIRASEKGDSAGITFPDLATLEGELSSEQMEKIGFSEEPVLFGFDKSTLSASAKKLLDSNIIVLKKYNRLRIRIVGYTDARGPARYNQLLSERRAKSVMNYLIKHGIDGSQVAMVEGKGEKELVNNCDDSRPCRESEHKKNRRVRVILISEKITQ